MKKLVIMIAVTAALGLLTGCGGKMAEALAISEQEDTQKEDQAAQGAVEEKAGGPAVQGEKENASDDLAAPEEILIAAAASLKNVYEDQLIPMFQEGHPNITVKGAYDSSGKLQTQIEEGLEADLFMSAAMKQINALDEKGLVDSETITCLLENKIVLIVPAGNELELEAFEDIKKADSIALGDPGSVPAGQYAKEALTALGIWEEIQPKVSFGTNVTEVLSQVAAGSADAGIVYATDAASMAEQVFVVAEAPEGSLSEKVIYPLAIVRGSSHRRSAEAFLEFLTSPEAIEAFQAYGFSTAE